MQHVFYFLSVCYLVGPQGSIKLFNLDTLLYVGDFKGKFVIQFDVNNFV